jgi:DNA-binding response OmpR family regulator
MSSATKQPPHQRIGVLDPVFRTREHMRRAIRAFGHAPLVFDDLQELLFLPPASLRCTAMCIGLPRGLPDLRSWVRGARNAVGPGVPLFLITHHSSPRQFRSLGSDESDLLAAAPLSFSDVYLGLRGCMARHAMAPVRPGLAWGPFRFVPATESVIVDDEEIKLSALEFELALEFFHRIGQVLARSYLLSVASSLSPGGSGAWLNDCIEVLSDKLDLRPSRGCEWLLAPVRSQGYRLTRAKPPNCHFQKDMQGAARVLAD